MIKDGMKTGNRRPVHRSGRKAIGLTVIVKYPDCQELYTIESNKPRKEQQKCKNCR